MTLLEKLQQIEQELAIPEAMASAEHEWRSLMHIQEAMRLMQKAQECTREWQIENACKLFAETSHRNGE